MIGQRKEKPRLQRVEKPTIPSLAHTLMSATGESSELGWIISYADLLMILLCFFVLFYSSSPETEGSVIQKILNMESKELQQNQGSTVLAVPAELNANSVLLKKLSINLSSFDLNCLDPIQITGTLSLYFFRRSIASVKGFSLIF